MKKTLLPIASLFIITAVTSSAQEITGTASINYDISAAKQVQVANVKERLDLDAYGGSKRIKGQATGWFALQKINGRSWLVTPEGHGMISLGVVHLAQTYVQPIYAAAYHSDPTACMKDMADNLRRWGFSGGSSERVRHRWVQRHARLATAQTSRSITVSSWK